MVNLSLLHLANIAISTLALIPSLVLIRMFIRTRISEYLLFAIFFIFGSIAGYMVVIVDLTNALIYWKILGISTNATYFVLFLHATRVRWEKPPRLIWYVGLSWFSILVVSILLWQSMDLPDRARVLFWEMPANYSPVTSGGAGLEISDNVYLYASSFSVLGTLFIIFTVCLLLYTYTTLKPVMATKRVNRTRRLWILAFIPLLIFWVNVMPGVGILSNTIAPGLVIVLLVLVVYITIFLPESVLITQTQIIRAQSLYRAVLLGDVGIIDLGKVEKISEYIKQLPKDLGI